jgi:hypothetical protein
MAAGHLHAAAWPRQAGLCWGIDRGPLTGKAARHDVRHVRNAVPKHLTRFVAQKALPQDTCIDGWTSLDKKFDDRPVVI